MNKIITKETIYVNTNFKNQNEIMEFLALELEKNNKSNSSEKTVKDFFKREEEFSTYVGNEIAIPHCKSESIIEPALLIVKNLETITWTNNDEYAKNFFAIAMPDKYHNNTHLIILSRLASQLGKSDFINQFNSLNTEHEIYELFKEIGDE